MYLFSDPDDPQHRYFDSWDPTLGVLSYGGYLNESFQDDNINCTIKLKPNQPHPGVYAKRDIYLHEELFTGYGRPQWIYTLFFFPNHLSPQTLQSLNQRYHLPTNITADMVDIIRPEDLPLIHQADHTELPDAPDHPTAHTVEVPATNNTPTPPPLPPTPNNTPPHPTKPQTLSFPHGTHEGVGIGLSTMPNAGQGLYGIRPLPDAPHLFARKGQFVCTYATHAQQITAKVAKSSTSRYLWSTNTHAKFNPHAMYYDAQHAALWKVPE
jgi:hypothetical protein